MLYRMLGVSVLGLALCAMTVDAQGTKGKKASVGTIEIKKSEKGTYRFLIRDADGKGFVMPLPQLNWESKAEALKALETLKATLENGKIVDVVDAGKEAAKKDAKKDAKEEEKKKK